MATISASTANLRIRPNLLALPSAPVPAMGDGLAHVPAEWIPFRPGRSCQRHRFVSNQPRALPAQRAGKGELVIRLGIVGNRFGRLVQLPAFRADPRCRVVALAGSDAARTAASAQEAGVPRGHGAWQALIDDPEVDAVAIAVPPALQPQIATAAFARGKPVFAEKPLAADLAAARTMAEAALRSGLPAMVDFEFTALPIWQRARAIVDEGALGRLRHVAVTWNVENQSIRHRQWSWKTSDAEGGGVLGNFVSHSVHYLEWFAGPIAGLSARIFRLPDADVAVDSMVVLAFAFASGASGSLSMNCAAYLGSGHEIECYGSDGTLILRNRTTDYVRGFELWHARRPAAGLEAIVVDDPLDARDTDGRIAPVSRLASRFLDAIEGKAPASPSFLDGLRSQQLLDAARRAHRSGSWIEVPSLEEVAP
jgi:predicted dehydrogenase